MRYVVISLQQCDFVLSLCQSGSRCIKAAKKICNSIILKIINGIQCLVYIKLLVEWNNYSAQSEREEKKS